MEKAVDVMPPADEATELHAKINDLIQEIDRLRAAMSRDQIDIERSQARTRAMLSQLAERRQSA